MLSGFFPLPTRSGSRRQVIKPENVIAHRGTTSTVKRLNLSYGDFQAVICSSIIVIFG